MAAIPSATNNSISDKTESIPSHDFGQVQAFLKPEKLQRKRRLKPGNHSRQMKQSTSRCDVMFTSFPTKRLVDFCGIQSIVAQKKARMYGASETNVASALRTNVAIKLEAISAKLPASLCNHEAFAACAYDR
jgi:hypothetical protein